MTESVVLSSIIVGVLTLVGVLYNARTRPDASISALSSVVKGLGEENSRLTQRVNDLETQQAAMRKEVEDYRERMRHVARLEAGVSLLVNQLIALGHDPLWRP